MLAPNSRVPHIAPEHRPLTVGKFNDVGAGEFVVADAIAARCVRAWKDVIHARPCIAFLYRFAP